MITSNQDSNAVTGFSITNIATCDFSLLQSLDNGAVLEKAGKGAEGSRLARFIQKTMGIEHRYHCPKGTDAEDLAYSALARLIEKDPSLPKRADFLIFAGISSPRPTATLSTYLAHKFGFSKVSCWDVKSGCSTALLAMIQAQGWLNMGAKCGVIVSAENLSRFSAPEMMQVAAATGDGAVAMAMEADERWQLKAVVHGSDANFAHNIKLPGKFPIDFDNYNAADYLYKLDEKVDGIETLQKYWLSSLAELLTKANLPPDKVNHYISHQVDGSKNEKIAVASGIRPEAVAKNFSHYGNMGSPTVLINYHQWINRAEHEFNSGDTLVFHAVGGGISWAGFCLTRK